MKLKARQKLPGLLLALLVLLGVACGGTSGSQFASNPTEITIADIQSRIFTPRCATAGCHITGVAAFDMVLSEGLSASNTINVVSGQNSSFLRIEPGNSTDSYLYMKVTADPRIGGDPMPNQGGPLSAADLELLQNWIDEGAN